MLELIDKVKNNPEIEIKNRNKLLNLEKGLTEDDNPILLIGKMKQKIDLKD